MAVYDEIPVPGIYKGDTYWDDELMNSNIGGVKQKGVTLGRAAEGTTRVILMGTPIARDERDKKYYPYEPGGANGLGTPRGFLRRSVKMTDDRDQFGLRVYGGDLKLSKLHNVDQEVIDHFHAVVDEANNNFHF